MTAIIDAPHTRHLEDEATVESAFYREFTEFLVPQPIYKGLAMAMLRRAHPRYLRGPSSSTGSFHPRDEFYSGPHGDLTGAPPTREGEFGGQVLHCKRVARLCRDLCRAEDWGVTHEHWGLLQAAALVHDLAQYDDSKKWTIKGHEALVEARTRDILDEHPEWSAQYERLIALCRSHSGRWCLNKAHAPKTKIESLFHYADYFASRKGVGEFDPYDGEDKH